MSAIPSNSSTSLVQCTQWPLVTDIPTLEAEIARRKRELVVPLERQRNSLLPISRLTTDVFREILVHVTSEKTVASILTLLSVSRVCDMWRTFALSEPRLWSCINLNYPLSCILCVDRSKSCLLDVSGSWDFHDPNFVPAYYADIFKAFRYTIRHAHRMQTIRLVMSGRRSFLNTLMAVIDQTQPDFPQLKAVHIQAEDVRFVPQVAPLLRVSPYLKGTNVLTSLVLHSCVVTASALQGQPLQTMDLSKTLISSVTVQEWRSVLESLSPTLQNLSISTDLMLGLVTNNQARVELPSMKNLKLQGPLAAMAMSLGRAIACPLLIYLQFVEILSHPNDHAGGETASQILATTINEFLIKHDRKHTLASETTYNLSFVAYLGLELRSSDNLRVFHYHMSDQRFSPPDMVSFCSFLDSELRLRITSIKFQIAQPSSNSAHVDVGWNTQWNLAPPYGAIYAQLDNIRTIEASAGQAAALFSFLGGPDDSVAPMDSLYVKAGPGSNNIELAHASPESVPHSSPNMEKNLPPFPQLNSIHIYILRLERVDGVVETNVHRMLAARGRAGRRLEEIRLCPGCTISLPVRQILGEDVKLLAKNGEQIPASWDARLGSWSIDQNLRHIYVPRMMTM